MTDYIKIPKDFKSLHDLKELTSNYEVMSNLANALNNYKRAFVEDRLMTADEVIETIPEKQLNQYTIFYRGMKQGDEEPFSGYPTYGLGTTMEIIISSEKRAETESDYWQPSLKFLVNHNKKELHIAIWDFDGTTRFRDIEYKDNILYRIDTESSEIITEVPFNEKCKQVVGHTHGFGYGFGSAKTQTYLAEGTEEYIFCSKTNTFKGFRKGKSPEYREHNLY